MANQNQNQNQSALSKIGVRLGVGLAIIYGIAFFLDTVTEPASRGGRYYEEYVKARDAAASTLRNAIEKTNAKVWRK